MIECLKPTSRHQNERSVRILPDSSTIKRNVERAEKVRVTRLNPENS